MPTPIVPPAEVEAIYRTYPRHVKPQVAYRAIANAIKRGHRPDMLLEKTDAYRKAVETWPKPDQKFIPYPATWFNGDRFLEDQSEWWRGDRREYPEAGGAAPRRV